MATAPATARLPTSRLYTTVFATSWPAVEAPAASHSAWASSASDQAVLAISRCRKTRLLHSGVKAAMSPQ